MRRTKLQDVATAAGVSKGAASHVFNHPERVKKEVRQHVLRVAADRLCGYRQACEDASNSRILLSVVESMSDLQNVGLALDKLLEEHSSISALLCGTDRIAINAIRRAKRIGIAVPDSLSVIGFDDIPAAVHSEPALTTVHQPIYQKGCSAVELLFGDRIESIKLDVSLKVRDSTAPR